MTSASNLLRSLVIYSLVLPVALVIGYAMATPMAFSTWLMLVAVIGLMLTPLLLKHYRPILFLFWNSTVVVFFLPGRPQVWIVMAVLSLLVAMFQRALVRNMRAIHAPSLIFPLAFLAVVILITAKLRGGFGLASMGDAVGGARRYFTMFAAMAGFLVMLSTPIPPQRTKLYIGLFFLGSLMNAVSFLVNIVPPSLYWIFLIFPVDNLPGDQGIMNRSFGLSLAAMGVFMYMLARFGLKEILLGGKLWRLGLLVGVTLVTMMGGYRSFFVVIAVTGVVYAYAEGLLTSKYLGLFVLIAILIGALTIPFVDKLPVSIQRTLSVFPVRVSDVARQNAQDSVEWRLRMWETLIPEIPQYLWLGKGLSVELRDLQLTRDLTLQDVHRAYEGAKMAGDYHNGPLTVLINFGIWGAIGWLWFLIASFRALYHNYLYGSPHLKTLNILVLSYLIGRTVNFFFVFGSFHTDFEIFVGLVGFAIALNGGIAKPPALQPVHQIRHRSAHLES